MSGVAGITDKILAEAQSWADEQITVAKQEAETIENEYTLQARTAYESAMREAYAKSGAVGERAKSQGEMDRRKMMLAARQECVDDAFALALKNMCDLSDEEKVLLMVKSAVKYQTTDAEYIFNAEDQKLVGPWVVETVNAIYKKEQLKATFSGTVLEQMKKLLTGGEKPHKAVLSEQVGKFAGGFILKQGDVESNCTFEVLVGGVREELEGEASSILFS